MNTIVLLQMKLNGFFKYNYIKTRSMNKFNSSDNFFPVLIGSVIVFIIISIFIDANNTMKYIKANDCVLTGNKISDPYFYSDSQGIMQYGENNSYEYFCKATNETKWFNYKFTN